MSIKSTAWMLEVDERLATLEKLGTDLWAKVAQIESQAGGGSNKAQPVSSNVAGSEPPAAASAESCPTCGGQGYKLLSLGIRDGAHREPCVECKGTGKLQHEPRTVDELAAKLRAERPDWNPDVQMLVGAAAIVERAKKRDPAPAEALDAKCHCGHYKGLHKHTTSECGTSDCDCACYVPAPKPKPAAKPDCTGADGKHCAHTYDGRGPCCACDAPAAKPGGEPDGLRAACDALMLDDCCRALLARVRERLDSLMQHGPLGHAKLSRREVLAILDEEAK